MIKSIVTTAIAILPIFVVLFVPLFFVALIVLPLWKRFLVRKRRSPITGYKLWRSPGETLRKKYEDKSLDFHALIMSIPVIGFYFLYLSFLSFLGYRDQTIDKAQFEHSIALNFITASCVFIVCVYFMLKTWKEYSRLRFGYEGELYVGQQLQHLSLVGCRVFHDVEFDRIGNIDHIVVSPTGVFAVETKARMKPDKNRGTKDATVVYDGQTLQFPDGIQDRRPLTQAKNNAMLLSQWLSGSTGGDQVLVTPVVALPGWFVRITTPNQTVKVYNGKLEDKSGQVSPESLRKSFFLLPGKTAAKLPDELFKRIVFQLTKKCQDVDPVSGNKKKRQ